MDKFSSKIDIPTFSLCVVRVANMLLDEPDIESYKVLLGRAAMEYIRRIGFLDHFQDEGRASQAADALASTIREFVENVYVNESAMRLLKGVVRPVLVEEDLGALITDSDDRIKKMVDIFQVRLLAGLVRNTISEVLMDQRLEAAIGEAERDPLTGLLNRRGALQRLMEDPTRKVAVIYVDLDKFGQVNKDYDETTGDRVLRNSARVMSHAVRPDDWKIRSGGEEFVFVLPDQDLEVGVQAASRLQDALHKAETRVPGSEVKTIRLTGTVVVAEGTAGEVYQAIEEGQGEDKKIKIEGGPLLQLVSAQVGWCKTHNDRATLWEATQEGNKKIR